MGTGKENPSRAEKRRLADEYAERCREAVTRGDWLTANKMCYRANEYYRQAGCRKERDDLALLMRGAEDWRIPEGEPDGGPSRIRPFLLQEQGKISRAAFGIVTEGYDPFAVYDLLADLSHIFYRISRGQQALVTVVSRIDGAAFPTAAGGNDPESVRAFLREIRSDVIGLLRLTKPDSRLQTWTPADGVLTGAPQPSGSICVFCGSGIPASGADEKCPCCGRSIG